MSPKGTGKTWKETPNQIIGGTVHRTTTVGQCQEQSKNPGNSLQISAELQKLLGCGPQSWRAGLWPRTRRFKKFHFNMKKDFRTLPDRSRLPYWRALHGDDSERSIMGSIQGEANFILQVEPSELGEPLAPTVYNSMRYA